MIKTIDLPRWDLTEIYLAPDSLEIKQDLELIAKQSQRFRNGYEGRITELDGENLGHAVVDFEKIQATMKRLKLYARMRHDENLLDEERGNFNQYVENCVNAAKADLVFFESEIKYIPDRQYENLFDDATVQNYKPWLDGVRRGKPFALAAEVEEIVIKFNAAGKDAVEQYYNTSRAGLEFEVNGEKMGVTKANKLIRGTDPDLRYAAVQGMHKTLEARKKEFTFMMNTIVRCKGVEDKLRNFEHPMDAQNLADNIERDVVNNMANAVWEALPDLSHRYYAWKARKMGKEFLGPEDRVAPLPDSSLTNYTWEQAKDIVLKAYYEFSPEIGEIAQKFFDHDWIDVPALDEKQGGAYAEELIPELHPFLLLNFTGTFRDVMTLAHEVGHGIHMYLSNKQGLLKSGTPLPLSETASIFGEMLTFKSLYRNSSPEDREALLSASLEGTLDTVVRQVAFHKFEEEVHLRCREGELSADEMGDIWMRTQQESLGPNFNLGEGYANWWTIVPHIFGTVSGGTQFYVRSYALGNLFVNGLYSAYEGLQPGEEQADFAAKYKEALTAGGTQHHTELFKPFGLNTADPKFWKAGLQVAISMMDQLEQLEQSGTSFTPDPDGGHAVPGSTG